MRSIVLATMFAAAGCAVQPKDATLASAAADALPSAAATSVAEEPSEFRPPTGYKLRADRGGNVYCTKIVVLGSRFPKEDCRTEAELRRMETQKDSARADMKQKLDVCGGGSSCSHSR